MPSLCTVNKLGHSITWKPCRWIPQNNLFEQHDHAAVLAFWLIMIWVSLITHDIGIFIYPAIIIPFFALSQYTGLQSHFRSASYMAFIRTHFRLQKNNKGWGCVEKEVEEKLSIQYIRRTMRCNRTANGRFFLGLRKKS